MKTGKQLAAAGVSRLIPRMLRRLAVPLILVVAILAASSGLLRLRFDTDILSMMPADLPEVKGLKAFHQAFSRDNELIMLIEGGETDEGSMPAAAESLAKHLEADGVVKRARWKPRWNDEPEGIAELLAYLWLNGDPAATRAQAARLSPANSGATVKASLEKIGTAMEGLSMVMLAHDPFGFLDHPAVTQLTSSEQGGEAFESPDGRSHLLFADAPGQIRGYREADVWLKKIRASIATWQAGDGKGLNVRLTGEPAFSSEIGVAMEYDLSGSISLTLGLIGILFWWMQRRFSLLLGLVGVLILVFAVAMGIAGWLYGELSIMALSSIEILIGLAVDYGLVICQEAKVAGHDKHELRKSSGPPVMCGAITTTVVFMALNLGGLPGMAQLGTIVAIGLAAAGILMLVIYLPFVAKFGVDRAPAVGTGKFLPRSKMAWSITGALTLAAIAILLIHGMPGAEFDSKIMRPRHSNAMESFERIQKDFPSWSGKSLGIVVEAGNDAEMLKRISEARGRVSSLEKSGTITDGKLPIGWWPDTANQAANRPWLATLAADRERLLREADAAGFTEEGLALGKSVLDAMARQTAETTTVFPKSESAREVMRLFLSRKPNGGGYLLGNIEPAPGIDPAGDDYETFRAITGGGIWLSGWALFKPAIAKLVGKDMTRMLVPMFILLVGMMIVIFRRASDVALALFAMVICTVLLLAIMSLTGLKWNFVNLMATPLLLGTGIDYAIHVTLSLRRTHGDYQELWQGTGKALLFCGVSNVIGFGSLIFSSSDALVSLGIVSVIGIVLSMAISIFLLPGWRTR
ncbi:MAG: MMPL family transporter [Luteolibacter sp.]